MTVHTDRCRVPGVMECAQQLLKFPLLLPPPQLLECSNAPTSLSEPNAKTSHRLILKIVPEKLTDSEQKLGIVLPRHMRQNRRFSRPAGILQALAQCFTNKPQDAVIPYQLSRSGSVTGDVQCAEPVVPWDMTLGIPRPIWHSFHPKIFAALLQTKTGPTPSVRSKRRLPHLCVSSNGRRNPTCTNTPCGCVPTGVLFGSDFLIGDDVTL